MNKNIIIMAIGKNKCAFKIQQQIGDWILIKEKNTNQNLIFEWG